MFFFLYLTIEILSLYPLISSTDQLKFNLVKKKLNLIKTDLARTTVELNKYEKSVEKAEDAGVGIESYLSAYEKLTKSHENLLNVVRENNPEQTQQNSDSKFNDCVNGFIRTVGLKAYNEMVNGTFEVLENEDILKLQLFRVFSDVCFLSPFEIRNIKLFY
jgi:hypothetical protein